MNTVNNKGGIHGCSKFSTDSISGHIRPVADYYRIGSFLRSSLLGDERAELRESRNTCDIQRLQLHFVKDNGEQR